jgi:hypothetical protein
MVNAELSRAGGTCSRGRGHQYHYIPLEVKSSGRYGVTNQILGAKESRWILHTDPHETFGTTFDGGVDDKSNKYLF